jgi:prolyl-tRNA editing enzyme YbaK/EbsC (Cys-tRNA(Pro) deacylase)
MPRGFVGASHQGCTEVTWPEPVERVASFLRRSGADARIEELPTDASTAPAAADAVGSTLGQIVKSLVFMCDGTPALALVPGDRKADTGKIARLLDARRVTIARAEDVVEATGFAPGGVAPFPLERVPVVLVERTLLRHGVVWAGAGSERHLIAIAPAELVRLTRGRLEDVVLESP